MYVYVGIAHISKLCKKCKISKSFLENGSNKQELTVMYTSIITQISSAAVFTGSVPLLSLLSSAHHRYTHQGCCWWQGWYWRRQCWSMYRGWYVCCVTWSRRLGFGWTCWCWQISLCWCQQFCWTCWRH